jgi:hypothetical protein
MRRVTFAVTVLVALLGAAQLVLPRLAQDRVRDELRASGTVLSVRVSAFPAIKLLFDRADRVEVHVGEATAAPGRLAELIDSTRRTRELDARADVLRIGPLVLRDLRLRKDGERLDGEAAVRQADLSAALPVEVGLRPVQSADGALVLEATAGPFAVRARLSASDGALVIAPDGLLGGFASLTVFSDPRVAVTAVGARARPDGFTLTARGRLGRA